MLMAEDSTDDGKDFDAGSSGGRRRILSAAS